jgi:hypothetical protein
MLCHFQLSLHIWVVLLEPFAQRSGSDYHDYSLICLFLQQSLRGLKPKINLEYIYKKLAGPGR